MFVKTMFSTLCICMQIMFRKTNYVIVNENETMFEPIMDFSL